MPIHTNYPEQSYTLCMKGYCTILLLFTALLVTCAHGGTRAGGSTINKFLGEWEFSECWSTTVGVSPCVVYQARVSRTDGKTIVDIDIDGYQSMSRIKAEGRLANNTLKILFVENREDALLPQDVYNSGDVLFELSAQDGKVFTVWRKMTPKLAKYHKKCICFVKLRKQEHNN